MTEMQDRKKLIKIKNFQRWKVYESSNWKELLGTEQVNWLEKNSITRTHHHEISKLIKF